MFTHTKYKTWTITEKYYYQEGFGYFKKMVYEVEIDNCDIDNRKIVKCKTYRGAQRLITKLSKSK